MYIEMDIYEELGHQGKFCYNLAHTTGKKFET